MINLPFGISIAPLSIKLLRVTSEPAGHRGQHLTLTFDWEVLHRDTHQPYVISIQEMAPNVESMPPGLLESMIARIMGSVMRHEVDEVLLKDGKRVREPHR